MSSATEYTVRCSPPSEVVTVVVTSPCFGRGACSLATATCAALSMAAAADSSSACADGAWSAVVEKACVPFGRVTFAPGRPV